MIAVLVRILVLAVRLKLGHLDGIPTWRAAVTHAAHAVAAADAHGLDAAWLLADAGDESRYTPTATSALDQPAPSKHRRTGAWRSRSPLPAWRGPYCCGVVQATAETWTGCLALRPLAAGYDAGARELAWWVKRAGGDLRHALAGHGFGTSGWRRWSAVDGCGKRCNRYIARVMLRYEALR